VALPPVRPSRPCPTPKRKFNCGRVTQRAIEIESNRAERDSPPRKQDRSHRILVVRQQHSVDSSAGPEAPTTPEIRGPRSPPRTRVNAPESIGTGRVAPESRSVERRRATSAGHPPTHRSLTQWRHAIAVRIARGRKSVRAPLTSQKTTKLDSFGMFRIHIGEIFEKSVLF
jgi:hypothetical protein